MVLGLIVSNLICHYPLPAAPRVGCSLLTLPDRVRRGPAYGASWAFSMLGNLTSWTAATSAKDVAVVSVVKELPERLVCWENYAYEPCDLA